MSRHLRFAAWLTLVLLLIVVTRMLLLHYSVFVYDEEEYKTGSIAYLIMSDPQLPILEYQPGDYEGGTLLFGLLTIPFFRLLGPNYLALKLVALFTTLLMAGAAVFFTRRFGGWPAALSAGALFIFPLPYLHQIGLLPWGNYAENATLTLVALALASILIGRKDTNPIYLVFYGALLGLGVWVHYGFLVTVLLVLLWWWMVDPKFVINRQGISLALGAVVGFSPWIIYNATHNWWGISRFADAVNKTPGLINRIAGFFKRFALLWLEDLPAGMHFHFAKVGTVKLIAYLYYVIILLFLVFLIISTRKKILEMVKSLWPKSPRVQLDQDFWMLAPVGYVVLYALVYSISDYGLFSRQWATMDPESHCHIFAIYPPLLLISAFSLAKIWKTTRRWLGLAMMVLLLVIGIVGYKSLLTPEMPQHERLTRRAYDEGVIYMEIGSKWGMDHNQLQKIEEQLNGHALRSFLFGAGIKYGLDHANSLSVALDKCAAQPDTLLPYCWFGVGTGLYNSSTVTPKELDRVVEGAPLNIRPWLVLGSCVGNIWIGNPDHAKCVEAQGIDVASMSPVGEEKALPIFVSGHLAMGRYRPDKE